MGVIYKLKTEVINYIIEQKKTRIDISCRKLANLASSKFAIAISKSSINAIMKQAGLSMPVGRRQKLIKSSLECSKCGTILLKAADSLLGGIYQIADIIREKAGVTDLYLHQKTECLAYRSLFSFNGIDDIKPSFGLWVLIDKMLSKELIDSYILYLQKVKELHAAILSLFPELLSEINSVRVGFSDGKVLTMDGQFHAAWPNGNIPTYFNSTSYSVLNFLKNTIMSGAPLILLTLPEQKNSANEFISLMLNEIAPRNFSLFNAKNEQMKSFKLPPGKMMRYLCGFWPWQFNYSKKVKILGDFTRFYHEPLNKEYLAAETEVIFTQHIDNNEVIMRGCALKDRASEKIKVIILTNLPIKEMDSQTLATAYLNYWPNLDESAQNFIKKVELFQYSAKPRNIYFKYQLAAAKIELSDLDAVMRKYLIILDLYLKSYFMPFGYEKIELEVMKERFYDLPCVLKKSKDHVLATFFPPQNYQFASDLAYACRRINENQVSFENKKLWCAVENE